MQTKQIIKYAIWIAVLSGLGYWAYSTLQNNKEKLEADAQLSTQRNTVIPVVTSKVGTAIWEGNFNLVGSFAPFKQVALMSEVAGKVKNTTLQNGRTVKAGEIVLTLDNDLLDIKLATAKTNLAKAENDFQRLSRLLGDGGVTQQQVDDAQLAIQNLKAEIDLTKKQISMTFVRAPISGMVTNKMVENGTLVAPSMRIAEITDISRLKMQVYLTEEQVVTVKNGAIIGVKADIFPDKKLEGKVTFIDVNAGPSRRYLIEIEIPNPKLELKAGMTGTAYFEGGQQQEVLAVPRESIVGNLQDSKIYVVENGMAMLRSVETGLIFGDMVQVKKGLSEGEEIVTSGQINLEDGMTISVSKN